jgi:hypothetical protein
MDRCGATRKGGGTCRKPAGWGTPVQVGRCRLHAGSTPTHRKAARQELARRAVAAYGLPVDVPADVALLEEVARTAGHVRALAGMVAELPGEDLGWSVAEQTARRITCGDSDAAGGDDATEGLIIDTKRKAIPHILITMYRDERKHLREVCRDAIAAGLAERAVHLAEQQGVALAGAVRAILADLSLTEDQLALVPSVVPRHLRAAAGELEPS